MKTFSTSKIKELKLPRVNHIILGCLLTVKAVWLFTMAVMGGIPEAMTVALTVLATALTLGYLLVLIAFKNQKEGDHDEEISSIGLFYGIAQIMLFIS